MNDSAISALLHVDIPILMLHGTADESVPVVSAQRLDSAMKSMGKTNFTYLEYPDVDHSFIHTPTNQSWFPYLERDLIIWLNRHGVVKNLEAKFFLNRVRKTHKELQW